VREKNKRNFYCRISYGGTSSSSNMRGIFWLSKNRKLTCTTRATASIKTEWIFRMTEPPKRYPVSRKYTLVVEKYQKIKKVFIIGIP